MENDRSLALATIEGDIILDSCDENVEFESYDQRKFLGSSVRQNRNSSEEHDLDSLSMEADFISVVNRIDALINDCDSIKNWKKIKDLLHVLKGDLMTQN